MPASKLLSPPKISGTRRSSIYQRKPGLIQSPPSTRTRRQSMYVSSKVRQTDVDFFSKVWTTPAKQAETIQEVVTTGGSKLDERIAVSSNTKTPAAKKQIKTPKSTSAQKEKRSKTPNVLKASPTFDESLNEISKSPIIPFTKNLKTPKLTKKAPSSQSPELTMTKEKKSFEERFNATSTPLKSLEEITGINGKSFYGTPSENPTPSVRTDDVFVFSAIPSSVKKSARKSIKTPRATPNLRSLKTPQTLPRSDVTSPVVGKLSERKTPAVKRKRTQSENSPTSDAKLIKLSPDSSLKPLASKSAKKVSKKLDASQVLTKVKIPLSPVEMTTVLESAKKVQKRKASESPTSRPCKQAKVSPSLDEAAAPRVVKVAKRTSPSKLAEFAVGNLSNNSATAEKETVGEASLLNETFATDSRSSRCTIL
ncbi:uncharacterized protein LOC127857072 isoform X2 [Dreissena polymorpha]|nr:uncharacterized protein LOC127857072 isoform X2 [Dreissena polymorpha]